MLTLPGPAVLTPPSILQELSSPYTESLHCMRDDVPLHVAGYAYKFPVLLVAQVA